MKRLKSLPPPLLALAGIEGVLKIVALWRALRNRQFGWAVGILVINSAGIFPALYLWRFQKPRAVHQ